MTLLGTFRNLAILVILTVAGLSLSSRPVAAHRPAYLRGRSVFPRANAASALFVTLVVPVGAVLLGPRSVRAVSSVVVEFAAQRHWGTTVVPYLFELSTSCGAIVLRTCGAKIQSFPPANAAHIGVTLLPIGAVLLSPV